MNRAYFEKASFEINSTTPLVCPECNIGKLVSREKNISVIEYLSYNRKARSEEECEQDWLKYAFIGFLECDNVRCKEKIAVSGKVDIYRYDVPGPGDEYDEFIEKNCRPEYFERAPRIFPLSDKLPKDLVDCLDSSFALFWMDKESCANKIRKGIEILMDFYGISKYPRTGKRIPIPLQQRINDFGLKHKAIAEKLTAIKWIGNCGSHTGIIKSSDLMDAYQILKYVFEKLFSTEEKEIEKITTQINKTKRPRSAKKGTK